MARELVLKLDKAAERRSLSDEEYTLRKELKLKCLGLSSLERTIARQRSRIRFLAEGDANTKYFHLLARGRKRRNSIARLRDNNRNICSSHNDMEHAILDHFSNVFGKASAAPVTVDYGALGITALDFAKLELPFSEDEVQAAVNDMPADRAPGPDGFTGAFYKAAWPVIKNDIMVALNGLFFGDSRALGRLNNAFVVLLPKKPGASTPSDFRPITMIHSFGKLASKLFATRLAPRLPEVISVNQNAFIKGRTIHDNFKLMQRAAVYLRKKKNPHGATQVGHLQGF